MALLRQWISQRPWLTAGIAGATGGIAGIASGMVAGLGAIGLSRGVVNSKVIDTEHPFRRRNLNTLEKTQGL